MTIRRVDFQRSVCPGCGNCAQMYSHGIGSPSCLACAIRFPVIIWVNLPGGPCEDLQALCSGTLGPHDLIVLPHGARAEVVSNFAHRIRARGKVRK